LSELELLTSEILASPKYGRLCEDVIRHVGAVELRKRSSLKGAVKATKGKLHQIAGSYLDARLDYGGWLEQLRVADAPGSFKTMCRSVLSHQSSTRERLPLIEHFYAETLDSIAPVESVLDLGSGLNPLGAPWMPLSSNAVYRAHDVYVDMTDFIREFLPLAGFTGEAVCCDVSQLCSAPASHVVFMLKCVPVLDQLDRSATSRLLDLIDAPHFLISFPLRSLGGRKKGMLKTYQARMDELTSGKQWDIRRFEYPTELAFLLSK
jgi:16S rRNA (guanine(1405)-N(7))-methyltransferase